MEDIDKELAAMDRDLDASSGGDEDGDASADEDALATFVDAAHGDPGIKLPPGVFPWDTDTSCSPHIHLRSLIQYLERTDGSADDDAFAHLLKIVMVHVDLLLSSMYEHSYELNRRRFERLFRAPRGGLAHVLRDAEALFKADSLVHFIVCQGLRTGLVCSPDVVDMIASAPPLGDALFDKAAVAGLVQAYEREYGDGGATKVIRDLFAPRRPPPSRSREPERKKKKNHPQTSVPGDDKIQCEYCRDFFARGYMHYHKNHRCKDSPRRTKTVGTWPCCGKKGYWYTTPYVGNHQWKQHTGTVNKKYNPNECAKWWDVEANLASRPTLPNSNKRWSMDPLDPAMP